MRRILISEVIYSFNEVLKLSKKLPSILGNFGFEGPATITSCSKGQEFSTLIGETKPSQTHSMFSC